MGKISQIEYAEILFNDLGFLPSQRRAWLLHCFGTPYLDELSVGQVSKIIDELKEQKENRGRGDQDDDE